MKNYKYFTFQNFVAVNVIEGDMHFVDSIGFWRRAKILEIKQAGLDGRPIEGGFTLPLSNADLRLLRARITPAAFEKSLQELLLLMEEGLIVIGDRNDFMEKRRMVISPSLCQRAPSTMLYRRLEMTLRKTKMAIVNTPG
jgi:hypothetical protein